MLSTVLNTLHKLMYLILAKMPNKCCHYCYIHFTKEETASKLDQMPG